MLRTYTTLTAGSKHVSIVVQNITKTSIFLKKGEHIVHVVLAMLVPQWRYHPKKKLSRVKNYLENDCLPGATTKDEG